MIQGAAQIKSRTFLLRGRKTGDDEGK